MPTNVVSIKLDTRKMDKLRGELPARAERVLDKMAVDAEKETKDYVVLLHVIDTSALLNGINWLREGRWTRLIRDSVEYGIYQHEGWHDRAGVYHAGRPFMRMAFEKLRPTFVKAWGALFR
jgi:hypothetical protein